MKVTLRAWACRSASSLASKVALRSWRTARSLRSCSWAGSPEYPPVRTRSMLFLAHLQRDLCSKRPVRTGGLTESTKSRSKTGPQAQHPTFFWLTAASSGVQRRPESPAQNVPCRATGRPGPLLPINPPGLPAGRPRGAHGGPGCGQHGREPGAEPGQAWSLARGCDCCRHPGHTSPSTSLDVLQEKPDFTAPPAQAAAASSSTSS